MGSYGNLLDCLKSFTTFKITEPKISISVYQHLIAMQIPKSFVLMVNHCSFRVYFLPYECPHELTSGRVSMNE